MHHFHFPNRSNIFLFAAGLLLLSHCGQQPGQSLLVEGGQPLRLGTVTVPGVEVQSPYVLQVEPGRPFILNLAHGGQTPIQVAISGAEQESATLVPGEWNEIKGRTKASQLRLTWAQGSLWMSHLYQGPAKKTKKPNLLLISIDTLRADHFNADTMPETFRLFQQGVVFGDIHTPTPWTLPAHASLLSGQYPARHGIRQPNEKLPEEAVTLAEVFRDSGYYTWALTEGNYVSAVFGLDQGFHRYMENPPAILGENPESVSKLAANVVTLEEELKRHRDTPRFVFFHTYEVHCPYFPRGGLDDEKGLGQTQWLLDHDGEELDPESVQKLKALYAEEVRYTDHLLAPLLEKLIETGEWMVVLTSDHGEEFGEHGGLLHADTLYEETTKIPLALVGAGIPKRGLVNRSGSLVDVATTLADLFSITPPPQWQGRSLMEPLEAEYPVFSESFFLGHHRPAQDPRLLAVWMKGDKLIQNQNFGKVTAELYELKADPLEQHNLQGDQVEKRDALFQFIQAYGRGKSLPTEQIEGLTEAQLETMRSLGYIQ